MELKQKDLFIIYAVVGLLFSWAVFKVVFAPFHEKLSNLGKAVLLEESRIKKGVSLVENKDSIRKEYDKYASYFSLQDASDESAKANFLKEIEKTGRSSGLTILDMKPQKEVGSDKFSKQYMINIKAEGAMKELVSFIYALRNSQLLFIVDKMVVAPKSEGASVLNISMTIVGVVFS